MKYFKMGEEILVSAIVYPFYIDGYRKWLIKYIKERKAFYVGYAHKHEGKVDNHRLTNIKSIKLLRIKFSDWGNDKFALLQDVRRI